MVSYKDLFKEDYTDIVKPLTSKKRSLSFYERFIRLYNIKVDKHVYVSDYELWMFSKLSYSDTGTEQEFIDPYYNLKYDIDHFISREDGLQFYIIRSKLTKDLIITFRGTDEWVDWLTNIQILTHKAKQFDTAKYELEQLLVNYIDHHIYLCGHSLGGALAQELFLHFYKKTKINLVKAVTFNSAGVRYKQDHPNQNLSIYNYIVKKDIVGNGTGFHYGKVYYVNPKAETIRIDPLRLFTHTLDQFTFNTDGMVNCIKYEVNQTSSN